MAIVFDFFFIFALHFLARNFTRTAFVKLFPLSINRGFQALVERKTLLDSATQPEGPAVNLNVAPKTAAVILDSITQLYPS